MIFSKSRGLKSFFLRVSTVVSNFGFTPKPFKRLLQNYQSITEELGCVPTFPITAVVLKRHPELIKQMSDQGVEFAVHGYVHVDYYVIPQSVQEKHYQDASILFREKNIPFAGFRAPFLRINEDTFSALDKVGFNYDSSLTVHWDVIDNSKYSQHTWNEYNRVLDFYRSRPAEAMPVLPRFVNNLIEIPVSLPDDEMTVERLGIDDPRDIADFWEDIFKQTQSLGELFTVQLHPERFTLCWLALDRVIKLAKRANPPVWITTLRQIAQWWRERAGFAFDIKLKAKGKYHIKVDCSSRATILVRNGKTNIESTNWYDGYHTINEREFILESNYRPAIGVASNSADEAISFLQAEGYIVEKTANPSEYSIYLGNLKNFKRTDERNLIERIDESENPIVRFWRWPDQARSAITITGDIDSITIADFVKRIIESSLESRRQRKLEHESRYKAK